MLREGKPSWGSAEDRALRLSPWREPGRKWQQRLNQAFNPGCAAPHRYDTEVMIAAAERQYRQEVPCVAGSGLGHLWQKQLFPPRVSKPFTSPAIFAAPSPWQCPRRCNSCANCLTKGTTRLKNNELWHQPFFFFSCRHVRPGIKCRELGKKSPRI